MTGPTHEPSISGAPENVTPAPAHRATHEWASASLVLTAGLAVVAKVFGVVIAPGMRGAAPAAVVERAQVFSAMLGYVLTGLFVALIGVASFELAKTHKLSPSARFPVVALSGLVVALASPAVVDRLPRGIAAALVVFTSIITTLAGGAAVRATRTRAVGVVLMLLSFTSLLRLAAWETATAAGESASLSLFHVAQGIATFGVVVHATALLLAGAWLGSRSGWRARILANVAIVLAFVMTWIAGRQSDTPSSVELVLRSSLGAAAGVPSPFGLGPVAVFLLPASLFLALVALVQRGRGPVVLATTALALVAYGSFDVPLHALAAVVAAEWAMLARADEPV